MQASARESYISREARISYPLARGEWHPPRRRPQVIVSLPFGLSKKMCLGAVISRRERGEMMCRTVEIAFQCCQCNTAESTVDLFVVLFLRQITKKMEISEKTKRSVPVMSTQIRIAYIAFQFLAHVFHNMTRQQA